MSENQQNTQGDRIKIFIDKYCHTSIRQFARVVFDKEATIVYNIINGVNKISMNVLRPIAEKYPELNTDWLLDGKGTMIRGVAPGINYRVKDYIKHLELNNSVFAQLCDFDGFHIENAILNEEEIKKILAKYPELNETWLRTGEGEMCLDVENPVNNSVSTFCENVENKSENTAAEPSVTFSAVRDVYHSMSDGTKGLIIPLHLDTFDKKITDVNMQLVSIDRIISGSFSFFYQLQTDQLYPQLSKGDWLLLEPVKDLHSLVDGKIYLFNTKVIKVTCRMFRHNGEFIELVDINNEHEILQLDSLDDILEAFDPITALKNNPLIPLYNSAIGKELIKRDKQLDIRDQQINTALNITNNSLSLNKAVVDELIKSNQRLENLYFAKK